MSMTPEEMDAMLAELEMSPASAPSSPKPSAVTEAPKAPAVEVAPWEEPVAEAPKAPPVAPEVVKTLEAPPVVTEAPKAAPKPVPEPERVHVPVEEPKPKPTPAPVAASAAPEIALKSFIDVDQVKADISINTSDLDSAMIEHAGLELHYAMQTAHARRQYERLKTANEILEAKLDAETREKWVGEKKPTEAAIKAAVLADKRYSTAQAKLIDAQHIWKLCEATENSFRSRKDLLLEVARDRRKEKEGQLRVLEAQGLRDRTLDQLRGAHAVAA